MYSLTVSLSKCISEHLPCPVVLLVLIWSCNVDTTLQLLHHLVHHPRFKTGDMKSFEAITSGGAYLLPQFADQICAHFTDIRRVGEGAVAQKTVHMF